MPQFCLLARLGSENEDKQFVKQLTQKSDNLIGRASCCSYPTACSKISRGSFSPKTSQVPNTQGVGGWTWPLNFLTQKDISHYLTKSFSCFDVIWKINVKGTGKFCQIFVVYNEKLTYIFYMVNPMQSCPPKKELAIFVDEKRPQNQVVVPN